MNSAAILSAFIAGLLTMAFLVGAAFFLRFWRTTRDWLFLAFAGGLAILAANYALPTLLERPDRQFDEVFLLRLSAFVLIGLAIVKRNWPPRR